MREIVLPPITVDLLGVNELSYSMGTSSGLHYAYPSHSKDIRLRSSSTSFIIPRCTSYSLEGIPPDFPQISSPVAVGVDAFHSSWPLQRVTLVHLISASIAIKMLVRAVVPVKEHPTARVENQRRRGTADQNARKVIGSVTR